ncbi:MULTISPECIES: hypothetical protein [unclassified Curtobacterium]|uniref:hypothetical protein n=1 Tax=unclassified Curtobacterium TaxID=257496 RepID=UPI0015E8B035|nr:MULTISPECIES: hypothetical protein [unclassified Curtobacterium]WIB62725.1 hypothetical protein DEI94_11175 [Curtobacterium sp. MCBD17_040]WIB66562.1 hypothetical protein DEI93_11350 [Curtobacterium sp. MCBD17_035]WIE53723.1 hypothetical protein DEI88_011325 [Curtobacterium sp. MCBD17_003]
MGRVFLALFSIALLVVAIYLFGVAFQVSSGQGFIFFGGILLMCLSFGLPIHAFSKR